MVRQISPRRTGRSRVSTPATDRQVRWRAGSDIHSEATAIEEDRLEDTGRPVPVMVVYTVHDECRQLGLHIRSRGGRLTGRCRRLLWGLARGIDHLDTGNLHLERSRLLVGEHEPSKIQGAASQTILVNIAPRISPIGSIVKSARIVQPSNVVLTIYYVTISDEQHAELWSCFKVLHSRLYLV